MTGIIGITHDGHTVRTTSAGYEYIIRHADLSYDGDIRLEAHVIEQLHDGAIKVVKYINGRLFGVVKIRDNDYSRAVEQMYAFCEVPEK